MKLKQKTTNTNCSFYFGMHLALLFGFIEHPFIRDVKNAGFFIANKLGLFVVYIVAQLANKKETVGYTHKRDQRKNRYAMFL